uniref:Protein HOTHEAD-like n=1 Tax=Nelumbo nucifera TaxID=4432 RepID=A0A822ZB13_NELNU|nr:TPA_asm: hypothetical protein HUJ06_016043 [Nelumbo nucifera]
MLSGVGPAEHLRSHNIKVMPDHPMVGQGMSDNPINMASTFPPHLCIEISLAQVIGITLRKLSTWLISLARECRVTFKRGLHTYMVGKVILGPIATGHLELRNRNPDENPSVTFNYFKEAS